MDYRAVGELIWFALLGLSLLVGVTGLTFRFVVGPFIRDLLDAYRDRSERMLEGEEVVRRLERLERHLVDLDTELDTLREGERIDRMLEGGDDPSE